MLNLLLKVVVPGRFDLIHNALSCEEGEVLYIQYPLCCAKSSASSTPLLNHVKHSRFCKSEIKINDSDSSQNVNVEFRIPYFHI